MIKKVFGKITAVALLLFVIVSIGSAQTESREWTKNDAKKWVKAREWANGLNIVPSKTTDYIKFATQYHKDKTMWEKIFKFLKENNLATMPVGKYSIDGDRCFASITDAKTKSPDIVQIEAHKKYIDFQYIVTGAERMGLISTSDAKEINTYNPKKDVINYSGDRIKYYTMTGNTFFLLFPGELHKASVWVDKEATVRKVVVKIAYIPDGETTLTNKQK